MKALWTEREDALICRLREDGAADAEIARHFPDRTRGAVNRRIRQLLRAGRFAPLRSRALGWHAWTQRDEALVMKLRAEGLTLDEIARNMPHRTRMSVSHKINELIETGEVDRASNSPHSRRPWSREEDELIAVMRRAEQTMDEMAVVLGRSLASINGRIAHRVRKGELPLLRSGANAAGNFTKAKAKADSEDA